VAEWRPPDEAVPPTVDPAWLSTTTVRLGPGLVRVTAMGEIDMATAPRLEVELLAAIAGAAERTEVRVDLLAVTFIDAIGVGILVRANRVARDAGVRFAVERPQGLVLRILEVLGLVALVADPGEPARPTG
jgi:anti-sigma B factor antagonist